MGGLPNLSPKGAPSRLVGNIAEGASFFLAQPQKLLLKFFHSLHNARWYRII